jgi:hypothetical protein
MMTVAMDLPFTKLICGYKENKHKLPGQKKSQPRPCVITFWFVYTHTQDSHTSLLNKPSLRSVEPSFKAVHFALKPLSHLLSKTSQPPPWANPGPFPPTPLPDLQRDRDLKLTPSALWGTSRQELLAWLNNLLQLNVTKVEQCGTGYAFLPSPKFHPSITPPVRCRREMPKVYRARRWRVTINELGKRVLMESDAGAVQSGSMPSL